MSSPLNKIHVNNSTNISLNDRFTLIQSLSAEPNVLRTDTAVKGSAKNTQLIRQLEKRRKIMAALKLKKRSLRRNLQQRIGNKNNAINRRNDTLNPRPVGKLRRTNSLAAIATMNADKIQKPMQRRNSVSIADRLGYRRGGGALANSRRGALRRPLNRNNFNNLRRSSSKQNLNAKSLQVQTRSNGNANRSANNGAQNRSRSRSRSRTNSQPALRNNRSASRSNNNSGGNRSRSRSRSNIRARSNSVNSRLGANRTNVPLRERRGRVIKGRVFRRSVPNSGTNSNSNNSVPARRGRSRTRSVPRGQIQRQRSRSRSRPGTGGRSANRGQPRRGGLRRGSNGRGRGSTRGRGGSGSGSGSGDQPPKSKEELDKELEQYMENTKQQDQEMQDLINGS